MSKRIREGDVFEVSTPRGFAYIQYTSKHPEYGQTVRVLPGLYDELPDVGSLVAEHLFFAFYPVSLAAQRNMVKRIGLFDIPEGKSTPERLRRAGGRTREGLVRNWIVEEPAGERLVVKLSQDEKLLSLAQIWNHEMLVTRLSDEWRPNREV